MLMAVENVLQRKMQEAQQQAAKGGGMPAVEAT